MRRNGADERLLAQTAAEVADSLSRNGFRQGYLAGLAGDRLDPEWSSVKVEQLRYEEGRILAAYGRLLGRKPRWSRATSPDSEVVDLAFTAMNRWREYQRTVR